MNVHKCFVRRQTFAVLVSLVACLTAGSLYAQDASQSAPQSGKPPNIVIILADDFGYGSTNATGAADALIKTDNLNRLASQGKRFVNAYTASSVCSPTRYALLTGRFAFRTSLQRGVLNTFAPLHIGTDQLNVASW